MAILDFLFRRNSATTYQDFFRAMNQYSIQDGLSQPIPDDPTGYINDGYAGNGDVYALITKIIRMSQQGEIVLRKKEGDKYEVDKDHELNKFLKYVNPQMSFSDFWTAHFIYKLTVGNSYWYKPILESGINKGKTISMHIMPAQYTEVIAGDWLEPVKGYQLNFSPTISFAYNEVLHSKFFDPRFDETNFMYGISPLKAAAQIVAKLNEAEKSEQRQFENQSPPYLIYRKDDSGMINLSESQKRDLQKEFRNLALDKKRGKPMVLRFQPGIERLGISPVDLNILESSQEGMRRLCNIYQFPSVLMNDNSNSTYNNITTARQSAWTDCIIPLTKEFTRELNRFLIEPVSDYQGYEFYFDTSNVQELQTSISEKIDYLIKAKATPNELRQACNLKPIDNDLMNQPYIEMNETPLSEMTFEDDENKDFSDYE